MKLSTLIEARTAIDELIQIELSAGNMGEYSEMTLLWAALDIEIEKHDVRITVDGSR